MPVTVAEEAVDEETEDVESDVGGITLVTNDLGSVDVSLVVRAVAVGIDGAEKEALSGCDGFRSGRGRRSPFRSVSVS